MKLNSSCMSMAVMATVLLGSWGAAQAAAAVWPAVGPDGGDARRFAVDPRNPSHIYLGTTDSWIYDSTDGGSSWTRLARLSPRDNLVVDSLVVDRADPNTVFAAAWVMDHPDGGIYVSHDDGRTWMSMPGMQGQSVRALAQAPSDPKVLVAGTLQGVFRTDDGGRHWRQISPPGSREIHEVESIAIDPYSPDTIYAGTWHLPWKTTDDGAHWTNIKQGVIDDSDVFSIIIDRSRPSVIYASACSGIYRSDDAGAQFRKVQGIPSTARRTRVLKMDPTDRNTVYAGTTEGLYKTTDGGESWTRTTGPDVIINDVYVDPRNPRHVLLATDRSGVLASEDGGLGFQASNNGFSQRQVAALLADNKTQGTIYAGVINDKEYGGVFVTRDFGRTWKQQSDGLKGRDVFLLGQTGSGELLAGTSDGVFRWDGSAWLPADRVAAQTAAPVKWRAAGKESRSRHRKVSTKAADKVPGPSEIRGRVTALDVAGDTWYAATGQGLFRSANRGETWEGPVLRPETAQQFGGAGSYRAIAAAGEMVYAGRRQGLMISANRGFSWQAGAMPAGLTVLNALAVAADGSVWAGGREGLFYSTNQGQTWTKLQQLPVVDINSLNWDPAMKRLVLTSGQSTLIFGIDPVGRTWKWWDAGWPLRSVASIDGRLAAATLYSGVVEQPPAQMAGATTGRPTRTAAQPSATQARPAPGGGEPK